MADVRALPVLVLFLSLQEGAEYYPLREGLAWTYAAKIAEKGKQTEIPASTRVTGKKKVGDAECFSVETRVGGSVSREFVTVDGAGVRVHGSSHESAEYVYGTPLLRLKVPLAKGISWEGEAGRGGVTVAYRSKVEDEEEVEVPAGKYRAFRVRVDMESPAGKTESLSWYAKGTGLVRQWVRQSNPSAAVELTIELKSFEEGR